MMMCSDTLCQNVPLRDAWLETYSSLPKSPSGNAGSDMAAGGAGAGESKVGSLEPRPLVAPVKMKAGYMSEEKPLVPAGYVIELDKMPDIRDEKPGHSGHSLLKLNVWVSFCWHVTIIWIPLVKKVVMPGSPGSPSTAMIRKEELCITLL